MNVPRLITVSGRSFDLWPGCSYVIGRDGRCDIHIDDCSCSRRHAKLTVRGAKAEVYLEDCGSRNGTHMNGEKIEGPTLIRENSHIRVGSTILLLSYHAVPDRGPDTRAMERPEEFLLREVETAPPPAEKRAEGEEDSAIRGNLASMSLLEILQALAQTRRSGTLHVESPAGGGALEIRGGEILAAVCGETSGMEALQALAGCRNGKFEFAETSARCERNIRLPTQRLLLDICRVLDEATVTYHGGEDHEEETRP